jgi:hypothetical protein
MYEKASLSLGIVGIVLIMLVLSGCSSQHQTNPQQGVGNFPPRFRNMTNGQRQNFGNFSMQNMTDEQRQHLLIDRQKTAQDACNGKNEGDTCQMKSPRGEMEGSCTLLDSNLLCTVDRGGWQS